MRGGRNLATAAVLLSCVVLPAMPAAAGPSVDVRAFGSAPALGAPEMPLTGRIVDLAPNPAGSGYWLLGRDGGVFSYGVDFYGSTGGMQLNSPVIGMASTPTGRGYWFVAQDGGIFSYGDARFKGSTGSLTLTAPIVAMAATPTGNGYWLAAADGAVFAFGDARFHGSLSGRLTGTLIVSIAASPSGNGYALLAANGSLYSFGGATQFTTWPMAQGARDVALTRSGHGAWIVGTDGAVFTYGDAAFAGAATDTGRNAVAIGAAGDGYWIALIPRDSDGPPPPAVSGTGRRIVYSNSAQRVWLIEADGTTAHTFLVSGRRGVPNPGTYSVFAKTTMSSAHGGSLRLPYMTRFAHGRSLSIGFHGIPLRGNGSPIQNDDELGSYRSAGCVRMNQDAVKTLFHWAPVGTTVVVLA